MKALAYFFAFLLFSSISFGSYSASTRPYSASVVNEAPLYDCSASQGHSSKIKIVTKQENGSFNNYIKTSKLNKVSYELLHTKSVKRDATVQESKNHSVLVTLKPDQYKIKFVSKNDPSDATICSRSNEL